MDTNALHHVNEDLTKRASREYGKLSATEIGESEVHPHDGHAVTLNVRSDRSSLRVHTNGTHATVGFDSTGPVRPRSYPSELSTAWDWVHFGGIDNLKMDAYVFNMSDPTSSYDLDLSNFAKYLGLQLGQSDSWKYQICQPATNKTNFYGHVIAEDETPGGSYESMVPVGCGFPSTSAPAISTSAAILPTSASNEPAAPLVYSGNSNSAPPASSASINAESVLIAAQSSTSGIVTGQRYKSRPQSSVSANPSGK